MYEKKNAVRKILKDLELKFYFEHDEIIESNKNLIVVYQ